MFASSGIGHKLVADYAQRGFHSRRPLGLLRRQCGFFSTPNAISRLLEVRALLFSSLFPCQVSIAACFLFKSQQFYPEAYVRIDLMFGIRRLTLVLLFLSAGCNGGGSTSPPPPPSFSLSASPSSLLVAQSTTSTPVTLTANPVNGFTGTVSVTIGGLPNGVNSSTNSTFTLAAGDSQIVTFMVGSSVGRANYPVTFSGSSGTVSSSAPVTLTVSEAPLTTTTTNFQKQVIYQIVTDRFFDGDPTNNDPPQSKGLFDATKTNWQLYWGGDLAGIQQKMPYLAGMGITAIWISPSLDNITLAALFPHAPFPPFHGHWARDMKPLE